MSAEKVMIIDVALWADAPEAEAEEAKRLLEHAMESAVELPLVPLEVDFR